MPLIAGWRSSWRASLSFRWSSRNPVTNAWCLWWCSGTCVSRIVRCTMEIQMLSVYIDSFCTPSSLRKFLENHPTMHVFRWNTCFCLCLFKFVGISKTHGMMANECHLIFASLILAWKKDPFQVVRERCSGFTVQGSQARLRAKKNETVTSRIVFYLFKTMIRSHVYYTLDVKPF